MTTTTNAKSYKKIVSLNMGEKVCADHANTAIMVTPHMGICYACAVLHGEPVRAK